VTRSRVAAALAAVTTVAIAQFASVRWTNFGGTDEWLILSLARRGILAFPYSNRPLNLLWSAPGVLLTPHGFEGFFYLHVAYLVFCGWLTWLVARRLAPSSPTLALLAGVFAVSWAPLDMARLAPVEHATHSGTAFATLLAVVLFVESWRSSRRTLLALALVLAFLAIRAHEAGLALLVGAPVLLVLLPRHEPTTESQLRRFLWIAAWETGMAILAALVARPLLEGRTTALYQAGVLGLDWSPIRYLARIGHLYAWHLAPLVPADPSELAHAGVAAVALVFLATVTISGVSRDNAAVPRRRLGALVALGLCLAGMAYAVLALSKGVVGATRTQFLSAPGIGLFLAAAICLVASLLPARARGPCAIALATLVVAVGTGHTLAMQREWDRITFYPRQRSCLEALVREAPALRPGTLLLLIDEDGTWPFALTFRHAARLVYGDAITAHALGSQQLLYQLAASPTALRVTPWPVIQGPWRERPTEHRYDEAIVYRLAKGALSRLDEWRDPRLPPLPPGQRYEPGATIASGPVPSGRRVLD
jgi:hypothetical protein